MKTQRKQVGILKTSDKLDLIILMDHCDNLDLSNKDNLNFWLYCRLSIHSGLRSIDILEMKVKDIDFEERCVVLVERKTKKKVKITSIPNVVLNNINRSEDFVLWNNKYKTNVSLMTINRRLKEVFKGTNLNISSHSIRKAKARFIYEKTGNDIIKAMIFLNHSSPTMTKNYLNITQEEKEFLYTIE